MKAAESHAAFTVTVTVTVTGSRPTAHGSGPPSQASGLALLRLRASNELGEHGADAIDKVLRRGHLLDRCELINLDAVEGNDELFGFSKRNLVGGSSRPASFPDGFPDVERDTARRASHLTSEIRLATRESRDDPPNRPVKLQGTSVSVKLMQLVAATRPTCHLPSRVRAPCPVLRVPCSVTVTVTVTVTVGRARESGALVMMVRSNRSAL